MSLARILHECRADPVRFVREVLRAQPQEWQAAALNSFAQNSRLAIRSGHGIGKTALESFCVLWFLFTRPYSKVIATAPTAAQLNKILWSEISRWYSRSNLLKELFDFQKTAIYFREAPARWFAVARTAARAENFAGYHEEHILIVMDEASGIADEIYETAQGALTTPDAKLLLCGNPTQRTGFFFRAFHDDRDQYATMKVACADSDKVSAEYIERMKELYGADSDIYRVRVLGEFPKSESDSLISLESVEAAICREVGNERSSEVVIGVDVARYGDDSTVLAARVGNALIRLDGWRHADLMTTCGRIKRAVAELEKKYSKSAQIYIDETGIGSGVVDRLKELGINVRGVNNGSKAHDSEKFANRVSELYFALRERFAAGDIILAAHNEKLIAELSTRRYSVNSRGQLMIERKDEFKKRIGRSPDFADALSLAFIGDPKVSAPQFISQQSYWRR